MTVIEIKQNFLDQLAQKYAELSKLQQQYDNELQDIEHYLEGANCDAVDMVKAAKLIKEIRQKRRGVKIELQQLHSVCDTTKMSIAPLTKIAKKTNYTYKTSIVNERFKKKL